MTNRIRHFREQRGLTQAELAAALGMHEHSVIRWEKGYTTIPLETLKRLAGFFHVAVDDLVPGMVNELLIIRTEEVFIP
jgi:transcriptional regulator with XRE-family HTH domain